MTIALILAASFLVVWTMAFVGAPLWLWAAAAGAATAGLNIAGLIGTTGTAVGTVLFAIFVLLCIVPLRRAAISNFVFAGFKKVLPEMSSTEREALEAGDVWWEAEMFRGRPDWSKLLDFRYTQLTREEQRFLDNECEELCKLVDDWKVEFEDKDLPKEVWAYIKEKKFFSMLIKKEFGGLGFSANAQSAVVTKLATKSITLAVTVMVPNSLGPGELLMHYGTKEQQKFWLPRLVDGTDIPCFGLTGPEVGSDATAMPDLGIVGYGEFEGRKTLGIRLNFEKRYITLAPVATCVGLAFRLKDPDGLLGDKKKVDYGITCALIPSTHPGVEIGRRHYPGAAFHNGPIFGKDVFIPVEWIIGGPEKAGKGWRMLVECLSAGRGISLPALATAAGQSAFRTLGSYARIRRQFRMPIGKFEGVQEATGRVAGYTYTLEAMRILTASAVDHCAPSVVTAIAKYHMTEMMRKIINDSMDVISGRGIQRGPRNNLATGYAATPVAITVEGANILTRNLMIFGQGAIRCHPFVFPEMEAARTNDATAFDKLLFGHIGFSINRGIRAFTHGITGAAFARAPVDGVLGSYFRQMERMSSSLAFVSDVTMGVLGGELKRKERLSARLGDVLSQLYIASAVAKFYLSGSKSKEETLHARWALDHCLYEIGKAFEGFFDNFPLGPVGGILRFVVFPLGNPYKPVSDRLNQRIADLLMEETEVRERLTWLVFKNGGPRDPVGRFEHAFEALKRCEPAYVKFFKMAAKGELAGDDTPTRLKDAVTRNLLTREEADLAAEFDKIRFDVIQTDHFSKAYIAGDYAADRNAALVDIATRRGQAA
jgi:acyl-CoA dehydrogenase